MVLYGDGSDEAVMETVTALRGQMLRGKLHPATLNALLYYRYGKPKETIEISGAVFAKAASDLSDAELAALVAGGVAAYQAIGKTRALPDVEVLALPALTDETAE